MFLVHQNQNVLLRKKKYISIYFVLNNQTFEPQKSTLPGVSWHSSQDTPQWNAFQGHPPLPVLNELVTSTLLQDIDQIEAFLFFPPQKGMKVQM